MDGSTAWDDLKRAGDAVFATAQKVVDEVPPEVLDGEGSGLVGIRIESVRALRDALRRFRL
jgi:hypothetical protein